MNIQKVIHKESGIIIYENEDGTVWKRSEGTVAWRCNNPGNLKFGPFTRDYGAIDEDYGGHAIFPSLEMGNKAHMELLFDPSSVYYNLTLIEAVRRYAPESDGNNPVIYQRYITKHTGVEATTLLRTMNPSQRNGMLACMRIFEGFEVGKEEQYSPVITADETQSVEEKDCENEIAIEEETPKPKRQRKRSRKSTTPVVSDTEAGEDIIENPWDNISTKGD